MLKEVLKTHNHYYKLERGPLSLGHTKGDIVSLNYICLTDKSILNSDIQNSTRFISTQVLVTYVYNSNSTASDGQSPDVTTIIILKTYVSNKIILLWCFIKLEATEVTSTFCYSKDAPR